MFSIKDKIKNLSLIKTAGVKNLCVVEIANSTVRFSRLTIKNKIKGMLTNKCGPITVVESFSVPQTEYERELENSLLKLADKVNKNNTYFLLTTSHCRHKIFSVPKTTGSVEVWIEENKKKIFSDIANPDQFLYSYEILSVDEDNLFILFSFARQDHLDLFISLLAKHNLKILSAVPINIASVRKNEAGRGILAVAVSGEKVLYSFYDGGRDFSSDEVYFHHDGGDVFYNAALQIKEALFIKKNRPLMDIDILIDNGHSDYVELKHIFVGVFERSTVTEDSEDSQHSFVIIRAIIKKLVEDYDNCTNLLQKERIVDVRERVEKEAAMRITLSFGGMVLMLLVMLNIFNLFIGKDLAENEEYIAERKSKRELMDKIARDKADYTKKLSQLNSLKWKRTNYSLIFRDISEALTDGSFITSLKASSEKNGTVLIEIEGFSKSQEDVSSIMTSLEARKELINVSLAGSGRADSSLIKQNNLRGTFLNYKIICALDDNKK